VALKHEEKRCQYLSTQAKIMTKEHEEVPSLPEGKFHLLVSLQLLSYCVIWDEKSIEGCSFKMKTKLY
jgi:hypothetical protein